MTQNRWPRLARPFRRSTRLLRWATQGFAVALITLIAGAGSSKAVEIDFGALTGAATACTHSGGDPGLVCPSGTLTFTGTPAGNLTATSYLGSPNGAASGFLTFKPISAFDGRPLTA
jgi:hypothetical protein